MALSLQENQFVIEITGKMSELTDILSELEESRKVYFSRSYSGLSDSDLAESGLDLTAAQLTAGINMIDEINNKFLANLAVTTGDWQSVMDQLRRL